MKRLSIILLSFATLALASCSALGGAASNSLAQATGQTCGSAILGLYTSYKATGTINLTNTTNLTNAIALATCYTQLKQNKNDANYRKGFSRGLIASSAGLITNQNVSNVVNTLLTLNGLSSISNTTSPTQSQTQQASSSVTTLMTAVDRK
jgi:hypothetical protein